VKAKETGEVIDHMIDESTVGEGLVNMAVENILENEIVVAAGDRDAMANATSLPASAMDLLANGNNRLSPCSDLAIR